MEEQIHHKHHHHHHDKDYDGFKESGKEVRGPWDEWWKKSWDNIRHNLWEIKQQGLRENCIRVIIPIGVVMILFRIAMLLTTIYPVTTAGGIYFFRNFATIFAWGMTILWFQCYHNYSLKDQRKKFSRTYMLRNTSLYAAIACVVTFLTTMAKLLYRTPENVISIVYIAGEMIIWLALSFFFYSYWKKTKKVYRDLKHQAGRIKL